MNVGIVGLGRMGLAIATSLLDHGFTVVGYRRHMVDDFILLGGIAAASSREVAERSDVVITCLPDDNALTEVVEGEHGLMDGAHPGLIVVDIGMLSMSVKEQARQALERVGVRMLDCPISGIPPMVLARKTVIFGSGDKATFDACLPVFEGFTSNNFYLGDFGAGMKMKCIANHLVAIHVLAAAEAMALSARVGLDPELVIKVISPSVASSTQFVSRAAMMVEGHYEPALSTVNQLEECIVIIDALVKESHSRTPLFNTAAGYYEEAIAAGLGDKDVAAMFAVMNKEEGE